jgi:hypothetical protein
MSDDPWLTEISPDDIKAAMQRKAAREALIAKQAAEITRLCALMAEISASMKAEGEFSTMQRRIARQRRALAKLYQRRHDKNVALATARQEGMEEARAIFNDVIENTTLEGTLLMRQIDAAIRAAAGEKTHISKDQQAVFEDALTKSVQFITNALEGK